MEQVSRIEIALINDEYKDVMYGERFHNHNIITGEDGRLRWEADPEKEQAIMDEFGAEDLNDLFGRCRADKNDPKVRELYRWIGYSIFGYWEVFYWEVNNEDVDEWNPQRIK